MLCRETERVRDVLCYYIPPVNARTVARPLLPTGTYAVVLSLQVPLVGAILSGTTLVLFVSIGYVINKPPAAVKTGIAGGKKMRVVSFGRLHKTSR